VFPIGTSTFTSATFTTGGYSGTAQIMVAGLAPSTYTVTDASGTTTCTVVSGDNTCYFESVSGAVAITQGTTSTTSTVNGGVVVTNGVVIN
jgi:hypothetical protein